MSTRAEIQDLLRFLSQDAKVPLPVAMSKVKDLQSSALTSPQVLAKTSINKLVGIFEDEKLSKQVLNAAKRVSKKRAADDEEDHSLIKRKKVSTTETLDPVTIEASLALPPSTASEDELAAKVLFTNRAPLVLAFAVTLLKYTMPLQPMSSRLSLAQAVVSVNSKSKAISLGIDKGTSAESGGWGQGQPSVRVMGREVKVMKRWGYEPREGAIGESQAKTEDSADGSQSTIKGEKDMMPPEEKDEPALWGLDLEALRSSSGPSVLHNLEATKLPIYTPQSARHYILKSFASSPSLDKGNSTSSKKKQPAAALAADKERNLGLLLQTLDLLCSSWAHVLSTTELDRRAWAWYVAVRPDVENGVAGWGGKGEVKLGQILEMRRKG